MAVDEDNVFIEDEVLAPRKVLFVPDDRFFPLLYPSSGRKCRVDVNAAHFSQKYFLKFENIHEMHIHFDTPPTTNGHGEITKL